MNADLLSRVPHALRAFHRALGTARPHAPARAPALRGGARVALDPPRLVRPDTTRPATDHPGLIPPAEGRERSERKERRPAARSERAWGGFVFVVLRERRPLDSPRTLRRPLCPFPFLCSAVEVRFRPLVVGRRRRRSRLSRVSRAPRVCVRPVVIVVLSRLVQIHLTFPRSCLPACRPPIAVALVSAAVVHSLYIS